MAARDVLIAELRRHALVIGEVTLTSGRTAAYYVDAKRAILRDSQVGLQSVNDLCDAHPELMRAAKYVGEPTRVDCPVCGKDKLVLLAYVYGDALKHDNGRVWSIDTGLRMAAANQGACCNVEEVCRVCQWNHLREAFTARRSAVG